MRTLKIILYIFILLMSHNYSALAYETLDTQGKAEYYYICKINLDEQGAGGNDPFTIRMNGICAIRSNVEVAGWGNLILDWHEVQISGSYFDSSNKAVEEIWAKGTPIFVANLSCTANPWAHGLWVGGKPTCTTINQPQNNIGDLTIYDDDIIRVQGPYPFSVHYLDPGIISAIAKGEETGFKSAEELAEELLGKWNPYGKQLSGQSALTITEPYELEMIDQNQQKYAILLEKKENFQELPWIEYVIEHLEESPEVVGDVKLPTGHTHWWQPFDRIMRPALYTSPIHVGVSNYPYSANPNMYRLRVRLCSDPNSQEQTFNYSPWRHYCIGNPGDICTGSNLKYIEKSTTDIKQIQAINQIFHQPEKNTSDNSLKRKQNFISKVYEMDLNDGTALKSQNAMTRNILQAVPTPIPLAGSSAFSTKKITNIAVKHMAGQKPVFEFEQFDGTKWRKARSIRLINMQPQSGDGTQVVTRASFQINTPGRYRYRVTTDASTVFSPYHEFTVVGLHGGLSPQMDHAAGAKGAAGGAAAAQKRTAKAPAKSGSTTEMKTSSNELHGSDSLQMKPKKQLQPSNPLRITSPTQNQSFWAPANVTVKTIHDSRFQLVHELKKGNGKFLKMKNGNFKHLEPGNYKLKVRYATAPPSSGAQVPFTVKIKVKKQTMQQQPEPKPQPPQVQQQTQPQLPPQQMRRPMTQ